MRSGQSTSIYRTSLSNTPLLIASIRCRAASRSPRCEPGSSKGDERVRQYQRCFETADTTSSTVENAAAGLYGRAGAQRAGNDLSRRACLLSAIAITSHKLWHRAAGADGSSEEAVRSAVLSAFEQTAGKSKAPVLLRLAFHDSGTFSQTARSGGANASVRFELKRPENTGLNRGWKVIDQTMQSLNGTAADGRVSYADLIALGGAYAVAVTGGPAIDVSLGRQDAQQADPEGRLPVESASADELLKIFGDKGFNAQEFVALSGAHTLGNKGFGDPVTFDNEYFKALQQRPWEDKSNSMAAMIGLPSDHVLPDSKLCQPAIQRYAASQTAFFEDFAAAYTKLTTLGTSLA